MKANIFFHFKKIDFVCPGVHDNSESVQILMRVFVQINVAILSRFAFGLIWLGLHGLPFFGYVVWADQMKITLQISLRKN